MSDSLHLYTSVPVTYHLNTGDRESSLTESIELLYAPKSVVAAAKEIAMLHAQQPDVVFEKTMEIYVEWVQKNPGDLVETRTYDPKDPTLALDLIDNGVEIIQRLVGASVKYTTRSEGEIHLEKLAKDIDSYKGWTLEFKIM